MLQMRHEDIGAAKKRVHLGLYAACFKDCCYTRERSLYWLVLGLAKFKSDNYLGCEQNLDEGGL